VGPGVHPISEPLYSGPFCADDLAVSHPVEVATGVARHGTAIVDRRKRSRSGATSPGSGLLFRRSEERLIETSFNGISFTLQE